MGEDNTERCLVAKQALNLRTAQKLPTHCTIHGRGTLVQSWTGWPRHLLHFTISSRDELATQAPAAATPRPKFDPRRALGGKGHLGQCFSFRLPTRSRSLPTRPLPTRSAVACSAAARCSTAQLLHRDVSPEPPLAPSSRQEDLCSVTAAASRTREACRAVRLLSNWKRAATAGSWETFGPPWGAQGPRGIFKALER